MKESSKTNFWIAVLAVLCCGIPLLLVIGGGSLLAFAARYFTGNSILFILAVILVFVFAWLTLRRKL